MKETIPVASDHAGYNKKEIIKGWLEKMGYTVKDYGAYSPESVDYPDTIHPLAFAIENGEFSRGIILCGSGIGASMTANKHIGVRAALCWTEELAKLSRLHNDANILSLPARFITDEEALRITDVFMNTSFEGGRHKTRVEKINILQ